ncbi:MAG: hypothetical protein COU06_01710 [Candidatus Harrisonbacteria bacterium CG10_big_fil_rev_8_21_14_0_10_38_8]|uniref:Uncharacterized protein n=1 Tax=Candidatus Harrisonbacteria bacterium CG10_big_fil_rev_8_21_14_0_10_38_8 TaxID=1974582 RepID=A0A2M6WJY3_9BACT|nr:MAG: hypothetical protein COU06_01710 [Candidatus Harrisonbacteria bacterium CG10_big_fil_rev_8_21_14_0_10_38_8]
MASYKKNQSIAQYQKFIEKVYAVPGDRNFSLEEILVQHQRFTMRALKGIRKNDQKKLKFNLLDSFSWSFTIANRLHFSLENILWQRFSYLCSYCASVPCICKIKKVKKRRKIIVDNTKRPKSLKGFQKMFNEIYPKEGRTLEHAGIHLAEESGEVSEAVHAFLTNQTNRKERFLNIKEELADYISCSFGVANSSDIDIAEGLSDLFYNNCLACHKAPCKCTLDSITNFPS